VLIDSLILNMCIFFLFFCGLNLWVLVMDAVLYMRLRLLGVISEKLIPSWRGEQRGEQFAVGRRGRGMRWRRRRAPLVHIIATEANPAYSVRQLLTRQDGCITALWTRPRWTPVGESNRPQSDRLDVVHPPTHLMWTATSVINSAYNQSNNLLIH
jgi:hypothetical protein